MAMLRWVMRHRWVVVLACAGDAAVASARSARRVAKGFVPDDDQGAFQVNVRAPEGTSLAVDARSSASASRGRSASRSRACCLTTTTIGDTEQRTPNKAGIYVRLVDPDRARADA